nr:ribonuclease H-like domain-containing protein [Tanacetum cinerariifolium]
MELETTQTSTIAKLLMLKQGNYEMWRLRIKQYFQVQDYALWDVMESGNSFVPVTQTTTAEGGDITIIILNLLTAEENIKKKNDVKAKKTRFGGNEATKKTRKTLLKQMYENFSATSTASFDSIFNRLRKIISQLAVLDTMSINDLYNNFKIVKQKVKRTKSSNLSSQNMAFVSSPSTNSTNEVHTAYGKTRKKITIDGSDAAGSDKSKVECYNFHKMGHFARECRRTRSQDSINSYGPKSCEIESKNDNEDIPNELKEYPDDLLVKDRVSDNKDCSVESPVMVEKKSDVPTIAKVEFVDLNNKKNQPRPVNTARPRPINTARPRAVNTARPNSVVVNVVRENHFNAIKASPCHPQQVQEDQGYVDSGCSRHMIGNMSYLSNFKEFYGEYVRFGGGENGGRINGKGTLKTSKHDFEDVYFVKELKFNLLSVSQMCDKRTMFFLLTLDVLLYHLILS